MEVDPAVSREPTGHAGSESGGNESAATPLDEPAPSSAQEFNEVRSEVIAHFARWLRPRSYCLRPPRPRGAQSPTDVLRVRLGCRWAPDGSASPWIQTRLIATLTVRKRFEKQQGHCATAASQRHRPIRPRGTVGPRPSLAMRLRTRARRARLDAELAAGTDPATTPEHRLRAAQLGSPEVRTRLANGLVKTGRRSAGAGKQELASARRRRARRGGMRTTPATSWRWSRRYETRSDFRYRDWRSARLVEDQQVRSTAPAVDIGDVVRSTQSALSAPAAEPRMRSAARRA